MLALRRSFSSPDGGFALIELLVAATLLVPLSLLATELSLHALRGLAVTRGTAQQEAALSTAAAVLEAELASLAPGDGLLAIAPTRIRFRASRAAGRWCFLDTTGIVMPAGPGPWAASRLPVPGRDSVVLEVRDSLLPSGSRRARISMTGPPVASSCPGGVPGTRLPIQPGAALVAISRLAQTEEVVELAAYVSAGETWLGVLHLGLGTPIEPVAGPFDAAGIRFEGIDSLGASSVVPHLVRLIRVHLVPTGPSPSPRTVDVPLRG